MEDARDTLAFVAHDTRIREDADQDGVTRRVNRTSPPQPLEQGLKRGGRDKFARIRYLGTVAVEPHFGFPAGIFVVPMRHGVDERLLPCELRILGCLLEEETAKPLCTPHLAPGHCLPLFEGAGQRWADATNLRDVSVGLVVSFHTVDSEHP